MPGFGSGLFGQGSFGSWWWSRNVLWESIPEVYREEDAKPAPQGGDEALEDFMEALRPSFDRLKDKMGHWSDLRDPLLVRTQYDEVVCLILGKKVDPLGDFIRSGTDAYVSSVPVPPNSVYSESGRFDSKDEGRTLVVSGSEIARNNRRVAISKIMAGDRIRTLPELTVDAGPVAWEIYEKLTPPADRITVEVRAGQIWKVNPGWRFIDGYQESEVRARYRFDELRGLLLSEVEQFGSNLSLLSVGAYDTLVSAPGANFLQKHVGHAFITRGSTIPDNNAYTFVRRIISPTQIDVSGMFDLTDPASGSLEWELRDGPVVAHMTLAGLSVPRGVVEQEGNDCEIVSIVSDITTVEMPSGNFTSTDVRKRCSVYGGGDAANNKVLEIVSVNSISELELAGRLALPEPNNGNLKWEIRAATTVVC